ncbi:MAG TPA: hypothetical protein VGL40_04255 [Bacillota bacterium]|jgi:cation transport regulator ChaB
MPWMRNEDLPPAVRNVLPPEAQGLFRQVANTELGRGLAEDKAMAAAWSACERAGWHKTPGGKWAKEATDTDVEFGELVSLKEAKFSADKLEAEVTLIQPGWSKNGRYYPAEALAAAAPLYEGARAFIDHPTPTEEAGRPERSVRDLAGRYHGVHVAEDGSLRGKLQFYETARALYSLAKEDPEAIQLSHNALGRTRQGTIAGRTGQIIEAIKAVKSVDLVTDGAAGGRLDRLLASNRPDSQKGDKTVDIKELLKQLKEADLDEATKKQLLDGLRESRPEIVQAITDEVESRVYGKKDEVTKAIKEAEGKITKLAEAVQGLTTENKTLREKAVAAETKEKIVEALKEAKLPAMAKERVIKSLAGRTFESDDKLKEAVKAAVAEEEAYIKGLVEANRVTIRGAGSGKAEDAETALKEAQKTMDSLLGVAEQKKDEQKKEGDK